MFRGVRFFLSLSGLDLAEEAQLADALEKHGAVRSPQYEHSTHVVVWNLLYNDPICAAARKDGKVLVLKSWVHDSIEVGHATETSMALYTPVRDLNGIPGSKLLCLCLTGYQGLERREIMRMVSMMGARFTKALHTGEVTHLICYKFEGSKYKAAQATQTIKFVNHRWLEDCLKAWSLLDEKRYAISGFELEEAESQHNQEPHNHSPQLEVPLQDKGVVNETTTTQAAPNVPSGLKEKGQDRDADAENCDTGKSLDKLETSAGDKSGASVEVNLMQTDIPWTKSSPIDLKSVAKEGVNKTPVREKQATEVTKKVKTATVEKRIEIDLANELSDKGSPQNDSPAGRKRQVELPTPGSKKQKTRPKVPESQKISTKAAPENEKSEKTSMETENVETTKICLPENEKMSMETENVETTKVRVPDMEKTSMETDNVQSTKPHSCEKPTRTDSHANNLEEDEADKMPSPRGAAELGSKATEIIDLDTFELPERKKTQRNVVKKLGRPRKGSEVAKPAHKRCFAISGRSAEKMRLQLIIKSLRGKNSGGHPHLWSNQTTHQIMTVLRRTEKFFAAAAAGVWILTTEFLDASKIAGHFVDEEEYEWHGTGLNSENTIDLAAPRHWRMSKQKSGLGAFQGMRAVIYGECVLPPIATLRRGIEAGGGSVVAHGPPYHSFLENGVDYAICGLGKTEDDFWVKEFCKHGAACVKEEYFTNFICKPQSSLEEYILFGTGDAEKVARRRLESIKVEQQGSHNKKQQEQEQDEEEDYPCSVCNSRNNEGLMLLCGDGDRKGCNKAVHTYCCVPRLERVPDGDWYCDKCRS